MNHLFNYIIGELYYCLARNCQDFQTRKRQLFCILGGGGSVVGWLETTRNQKGRCFWAACNNALRRLVWLWAGQIPRALWTSSTVRLEKGGGLESLQLSTDLPFSVAPAFGDWIFTGFSFRKEFRKRNGLGIGCSDMISNKYRSIRSNLLK